jgi:hypothetical protein
MYFLAKDEIMRYFTSTSLSQDVYNYAALVFTLTLVSVGIFGKIVCGNEPKKMSWIIGTFSGIVMSILGIIYWVVKIPMYKDFFAYGANDPDLFEHTDDYSNMAFLFFGLANLLDLIFGSLFYKEQLGLLTAWLHHSLFMWLSVASTTGNSLFMTNPPFASSFMFMCVEEIPTVILGVGTIVPSLRSDWGFGLTFISTRVVYHGYVTSYTIYMYSQNIGVSTHIPILYTLTWIMYTNWAYGWVKMMMKKGKKNALKKSS